MLSRRDRYPGPTYICLGRFSSPVLGIELKPHEPYVCRDELEAEALAEWERTGLVKRITRQQAYRLRRQRGET
jgi:hypothetical protein